MNLSNFRYDKKCEQYRVCFNSSIDSHKAKKDIYDDLPIFLNKNFIANCHACQHIFFFPRTIIVLT